MDGAITLQLLITIMLLGLYSKAESQWIPYYPLPPIEPPPLCASQIALANRACAFLPYTPLPEPTPPEPPTPEPTPEPPTPEPTPPEPPTPEPTPPEPPTPEPTPPAPPAPDPGRSRHHGHSHGHGHGHRHSRHEEETPVEEDCCRWLKEVDDVCVCGLLANLPPFLTRPPHNYKVVVGDTCDVTYECGSRLVQL